MKKFAVYARVSTDSQTVEEQLQVLHAVDLRIGMAPLGAVPLIGCALGLRTTHLVSE